MTIEVPDISAGDVVHKSALFKYLGSEDSTTDITGSSGELVIAEMALGAGSVNSGVLVFTEHTFSNSSSGGGTTILCRIGESTVGSANTLVGSTNISHSQDTNNDNNTASIVAISGATTSMFFYTGATWSNKNYIHITSPSLGSAQVRGMHVLGF